MIIEVKDCRECYFYKRGLVSYCDITDKNSAYAALNDLLEWAEANCPLRNEEIIIRLKKE